MNNAIYKIFHAIPSVDLCFNPVQRQEMTTKQYNKKLECRSFDELQKELAHITVGHEVVHDVSVLAEHQGFRSTPCELAGQYSKISANWLHQNVDERFIVSSVLVMFLGQPTSLFHQKEGQQTFVITNSQLQLLHITSPTLISVLHQLCYFASIVQYVRKKGEELMHNREGHVYEGFACALMREFQEIEYDFSSLHQIFCYQCGYIHFSQLVLDEYSKYQIWKPITLQFLLDTAESRGREISEYKRILQTVELGISQQSPLCTRVCELLDSLFSLAFANSLHHGSDYSGSRRVWRMLIGALEPYIRLLSQWITQGKLAEDKHLEFFVKSNEKGVVEQSKFTPIDAFKEWKNTYVLNLKEGGDIAIPFALQEEAENIIRFGKTIKVLQYWRNKNILSNIQLCDLDVYKIILEKLYNLSGLDQPCPAKHLDSTREHLSESLIYNKQKSIQYISEVKSWVQFYDPYEYHFHPQLIEAAECLEKKSEGISTLGCSRLLEEVVPLTMSLR